MDKIKMSVSMSHINQLIEEKILKKEISEVITNKSISTWNDLKKKYPKVYKREVDIIFDMLHPY